MTAKKKIFISTIISTVTILLTLLGILILLRNKKFDKEYAFNLGLPSKNFYEKNYGCSLEKILSFRNFKSYQLTSNESENQTIFNQIRSNIKSIIKNNDSKNGINVKFNIKTKYGEVVEILDMCEAEKVPTYILKDYNIWIMTGSNLELKKACPFKMPK